VNSVPLTRSVRIFRVLAMHFLWVSLRVRQVVLRSRLINGWHPVFLGLKKPSASVQAQLDMEAVVLFHCAAMGMSCPSCPWYSVGAGSLSKKSETKSTLRRKDQSLTTRNQEVVPSW
jgi:hypothetical protein